MKFTWKYDKIYKVHKCSVGNMTLRVSRYFYGYTGSLRAFSSSSFIDNKKSLSAAQKNLERLAEQKFKDLVASLCRQARDMRVTREELCDMIEDAY